MVGGLVDWWISVPKETFEPGHKLKISTQKSRSVNHQKNNYSGVELTNGIATMRIIEESSNYWSNFKNIYFKTTLFDTEVSLKDSVFPPVEYLCRRFSSRRLQVPSLHFGLLRFISFRV